MNLERERWFEIRMQNEDVNSQLEKHFLHQLKEQRDSFDQRLLAKKEKITQGDDSGARRVEDG